MDLGGLTKEWFLLLVRQIFHPDYGETRPKVVPPPRLRASSSVLSLLLRYVQVHEGLALPLVQQLEM